MRGRVAANDDAPSIGGLIYALNQKPSTKPFMWAATASGVWAALGLVYAVAALWPEFAAGGFLGVLSKPIIMGVFATVLGPIALFWFLAYFAWRTDELRIRSSTMTEVAIRLAEPDRMAEQSVATLGQAVRRQVAFMNDAVTRALGRAGELEALVHNEVTALERSYDENERKIRGLIQELAGERNALLNTSERVTHTLRTLGSEVPTLIDKLSTQQVTLARIIEGAGSNLTALESALSASTGKFEHVVGARTEELQGMLESYTGALGSALGSRTEQMQSLFEGYMSNLDSTIGGRTEALQVVFEEYARALDSTLANRAQALDMQLVQRTKALDSAFSERLRLFDDSVLRSTMAIDSAIGERAEVLTSAMETHAKTLSQTIGKQASELDETLMHGIQAVRRTSENITRQSIKAIEGLAGQSDLLKNVSENLLSQINSVTNRFESQGQVIMRAANSLESANFKIDSTLQTRHAELSNTLDLISGKADQFGQVMQGYSASIEGTMSDAESRARLLTDDLARSTEAKSRATLAEIERLKAEAASVADGTLEDMRSKFSRVTEEVTSRLGAMSQQVTETSREVRSRAAQAAGEIEQENARLRAEAQRLPANTRETSDTVRQALNDQLRALDHLTSFTAREAARRDVAPPVPPRSAPGPGQLVPAGPRPQGEDRSRALNTLSDTLSQELAKRNRPASAEAPAYTAPPPPQPPVQPQQAEGREGWSLGDLLARASQDEELGGSARESRQAEPREAPLQVEVIARAIDPATASAIWSRLRTGQRGIMVRSIYSPEGRTAFDEISRRYTSDSTFQRTVTRYLNDFEHILRETERRDPSGRLTQHQLVSETGRVYLVLAHASGQIS